MNNPIPSLLLSLSACLLLSQSLGCAILPNTPENSESDAMIGKPPPAENDPFAVISLPAEATPIAHQGVISEDPEPTIPEPTPLEPTIPEPTPPEPTTPEPPTPHKDIAPQAAIQPETPPAQIPEKPSVPDQGQCFSCVKICTTENTASDCSDAPQDLICGWGTAPDMEQAREVARAHCNTTLDMAREMPMYSRIEGDCPPATCR